MAMRKILAPHSSRSVCIKDLVAKSGNQAIPCVLTPRRVIGLPSAFESFVPITFSCPFADTLPSIPEDVGFVGLAVLSGLAVSAGFTVAAGTLVTVGFVMPVGLLVTVGILVTVGSVISVSF